MNRGGFVLPPQNPELGESTATGPSPDELVNAAFQEVTTSVVHDTQYWAEVYGDLVNEATRRERGVLPYIAEGDFLTEEDYRRYGRLATGIAYNRGVNRNDIEDVVQETLFTLARRGRIPTDSQGQRNEKGFVGTIAWRRISDYRRAEKRQPVVSDPIDPAEAGIPFDIPSDELSVEDIVSRALNPALVEAVNSLPDAQRTALLMEAEGYSRETIAIHLGISVKSLKSTINRARSGVKNRLQGNQVEE